MSSFSVESVPIIRDQAALDSFIEEWKLRHGPAWKWHGPHELAEQLMKDGVKIVVLCLRNTIFTTGDPRNPFTDAFKNFANLINVHGMTLYIHTPDFNRLKKMFFKAKIPVKFTMYVERFEFAKAEGLPQQ